MRALVYIEDLPDDIFFFERAIKKIDPTIKVTSFDDPVNALSSLKEMKQPPDMIFLDLVMPKMNGHDCVIALRKEQDFRNVPIIIVSDTVSKHQIIQFNSLGVKQFIPKSNTEGFVASLKKILSS